MKTHTTHGCFARHIGTILLSASLIRAKFWGIAVDAALFLIGAGFVILDSPWMWAFPCAHALVWIHFAPYFRTPVCPLWVSGFYFLLGAVNRRVSGERLNACMELLGLGDAKGKRVSKYSMGMRQRLGIAQAIMEDPKLLILDEPLNGLDEQGVEDIRALMLELKRKGKTILLSSHNGEDIDLLCDSVCKMASGVLKQQ